MKDPAALIYIDTWLSSTSGMDADCRGWYLNLILHQYDKKELPNDIETLAVLANVKFSEFDRFKQVFEQVLKQKFEVTEENTLQNPKANEIIRKREKFVNKRSNSGTIGYICKVAKSISNDNEYINYVKDNIDISKTDTKNKQVLKQVLKQMLKLYINGDKDKDNIDYNNFLNIYNTELKRNFKVLDEKTMRQLKARLKEGYTIDDIIKAAVNCSKDDYHIKNTQYLTPEFITRGDKLMKYLNVKKPERRLVI